MKSLAFTSLIIVIIIIVIIIVCLQYDTWFFFVRHDKYLIKKQYDSIVNDKIVVICSTGRSGSTTMLRLINTIPNSNICGENDNMIISILDAYRKLKTTNYYFKTKYIDEDALDRGLDLDQLKPAWYNSFSYRKMVYLIKEIIIEMFKDNDTTHVWGFKEVRIVDQYSLSLLNDFKELFPQLKVIIHLKRDTATQSRSSWWGERNGTINILNEANIALYQFYESCDYCFLSTFENIKNITNIKNIFEFIDSRQYYDDTKISQVLRNNMG